MSENLREKILLLRNKGLSYKKIREKLSCTLSVISYHCKKENVDNPNPFKRPTDNQIEEFNKLYLSGLTCKQIADRCEFSKQTVGKYITSPKRIRTRKISKAQSVTNWRKRKKKELVEYKGGRCEICGYDKCVEALHFHHIERDNKEFNISGKILRLSQLKQEIDKCMLVCSNCHMEIHYSYIGV